MIPFEDVVTGLALAVTAVGDDLVAVHAPLGTFAASAGRYANRTAPLSALRRTTLIWHESKKKADRIVEVHQWALRHHCLPLSTSPGLFALYDLPPRGDEARHAPMQEQRHAPRAHTPPPTLVSPALTCPFTHSRVVMHEGRAQPTPLLWPSCAPGAKWFRCHQRPVLGNGTCVRRP